MNIKHLLFLTTFFIVGCSKPSGLIGGSSQSSSIIGESSNSSNLTRLSTSKQSSDNNVYYHVISYYELQQDVSKSQFSNMELTDKFLYKFDLNIEQQASRSKIGQNDVVNCPSAITLKEGVFSHYYYNSNYQLSIVAKTAYQFESSIILDDYNNLRVGYGCIYSININDNMVVIHSGYIRDNIGSVSKTDVFYTETYAKKNSFIVVEI